jgi:hypothetical protein
MCTRLSREEEPNMGHVPPEPNDSAWYQIVRERLDKENELMTQRLNWLVTSQSFLFAAFGVTLSYQEKTVADNVSRLDQLRGLIPVVAVGTSFLIYIAILAGLSAMIRDRTSLNQIVDGLREQKSGFPPVRSPWQRFWPGLAAPLLLPVLFIGVWLCLGY